MGAYCTWQSLTGAEMAKTSTLTPSQAAAVLSVSSSTLRRWSADFGVHLSEDARGEGGKHRSYLPADVAILKRAGELLKTHAPAEVNQLLAIADDTDQGALVLVSLPAIAGELQALRDALMLLRSDVAALQAARQADRAELETMRASFQQFAARQVKRSKHQQAELEEVRSQLADLQARRHWWQRLRKP